MDGFKMGYKRRVTLVAACIAAAISWQMLPQFVGQDAIASSHEQSGVKMQYLVKGASGPSFESPEEAVKLLENIVIPSLKQLAGKKRILAGGLPVGDRAVLFIVEAGSNSELDELLRSIPIWPGMNWHVTPLQSFEGRAATESAVVKQLKQSTK